jgi:prepilin-type N-terminal cleavage/methylation domain-containing protein
MKTQKGMAILEVLVAVALMGVISVLFLSSAANSANARRQADERVSARILAESIIETVKKAGYSANYTISIPDEYQNYTANLTAAYMDSTDLQRLTVDIFHGDDKILTLEDFKVNR